MHTLADKKSATTDWGKGWTMLHQCSGWDEGKWLQKCKKDDTGDRECAPPDPIPQVGNQAALPYGWWSIVGGVPSHAEATFLSKEVVIGGEKKNALALHFSNMDSLYDMARYVAVAQNRTMKATLEDDLVVSQGFADFIQDLEPCLSSTLDEFEAAGQPLSYMVGKGLGASVATVYASLRKKRGKEYPVFGVYSFAGMETHWEPTGADLVPGYRFFHETDPIPGITKFMSGGKLGHNVKNVCVKTQKYAKCTQRKRKGPRPKKCIKYEDAPGPVLGTGSDPAVPWDNTSLVTFPLWQETDDEGNRKWFKKADPATTCNMWPTSTLQTKCRQAIKSLNSGMRGKTSTDDWLERMQFAFSLLFFHTNPDVANPFGQQRAARTKSYYQNQIPIPFTKKYGRNGMVIGTDVTNREDWETSWVEMCSVKSAKDCQTWEKKDF
jgi:hypothetical protein